MNRCVCSGRPHFGFGQLFSSSIKLGSLSVRYHARITPTRFIGMRSLSREVLMYDAEFLKPRDAPHFTRDRVAQSPILNSFENLNHAVFSDIAENGSISVE